MSWFGGWFGGWFGEWDGDTGFAVLTPAEYQIRYRRRRRS